MMYQSEFGQTVRKRKAVWGSVCLRSCNPFTSLAVSFVTCNLTFPIHKNVLYEASVMNDAVFLLIFNKCAYAHVYSSLYCMQIIQK